MNLEGKVALVTGGAHRVGRRIALALAREGCDLVVHYHRSQAEAEATVRELSQAGAPAVAVQADLSQPAGIEHLFGEVDRLRGRLDILINSAAILTPVDLLTATYTDWASTMDLNLRATFFCLQAAARRMQTRGGAIVNISDVAGQRPWRRYPIHSISKAGVDMLTRTAALALAPWLLARSDARALLSAARSRRAISTRAASASSSPIRPRARSPSISLS